MFLTSSQILSSVVLSFPYKSHFPHFLSFLLPTAEPGQVFTSVQTLMLLEGDKNTHPAYKQNMLVFTRFLYGNFKKFLNFHICGFMQIPWKVPNRIYHFSKFYFLQCLKHARKESDNSHQYKRNRIRFIFCSSSLETTASISNHFSTSYGSINFSNSCGM